MSNRDPAFVTIRDRITRTATNHDVGGILTKEALIDAEELAAFTNVVGDLYVACVVGKVLLVQVPGLVQWLRPRLRQRRCPAPRARLMTRSKALPSGWYEQR